MGCLSKNYFSEITQSKIDFLIEKGLIDEITEPKMEYNKDFTKEQVDNFNKKLIKEQESYENDIYFDVFFIYNKREYKVKEEVIKEIYDVLMENIRIFKSQEIRTQIAKISIELSCRIDKEQKIDFLKKELAILPKSFDLLHYIGINRDKKQLFAYFHLHFLDMENDSTLKFYFEGGIYPFTLLRKNDIAKYTVFDSEHPLTQRILQYYTFTKIRNYILFELKKLSTNKINSKNKKDKSSTKLNSESKDDSLEKEKIFLTLQNVLEKKHNFKLADHKFNNTEEFKSDNFLYRVLYLDTVWELNKVLSLSEKELPLYLKPLINYKFHDKNVQLDKFKEFLRLDDLQYKNKKINKLAIEFSDILGMQTHSRIKAFTPLLVKNKNSWRETQKKRYYNRYKVIYQIFNDLRIINKLQIED